MEDALAETQKIYDEYEEERLRKIKRENNRRYQATWRNKEENKIKQREKNRAYYQTEHGKESHDRSAKKSRDKIGKSGRKWILSLKIGKQCVKCGLMCSLTNYPAFHWDHLPEFKKTFEISKAAYLNRERVLKEIEKCQLLCANCHAIITYTRKYGHLGVPDAI